MRNDEDPLRQRRGRADGRRGLRARLAWFGAALLASASSASGCENALASLLRAAYPQARDSSESLTFEDGRTWRIDPSEATCTKWPSRPEMTLVAARLHRQPQEEDDIADLEVLVFGDTGRVPLYRHRQPGLLSEDALRIGSLEFDPTPYRLAPETPAFGLLVERSNAARYNPGRYSDLRLYVIRNEALSPILTNLRINLFQGEWGDACEGTFRYAGSSLSLGQTRSSSYADIKVNIVIEDAVLTGTPERCKEATADIREETYSVIYDGERYSVPPELKGMEEDYISIGN